MLGRLGATVSINACTSELEIGLLQDNNANHGLSILRGNQGIKGRNLKPQTNMELMYAILFCISFPFLWRIFLRPPSARTLPPGPTSLPIIGSLHRLGPYPNHSLYELAKIFGPLMTLRLGFVTTVIASSPETAKQILQIHDQSFSERTIPEVIASQPDPDATLAWAIGDQRWRNRRRVCTTQLFTVQRLNSFQLLRQEKVEQLIKHIKKHQISGSQINVGQVVFATTLNLISSTIFSIDIVDPEFNTAQEFKDLLAMTSASD
ncbi:hypothetical protein SLEP1_g9167 [Rubroshorea leprosula]|uniref:Cytochrome P450 n=1 Tax=Rubroshorea leprosula TaxID=152421 RepID=A0AAV5IDZ0_9ROSI|nr:hypothetical protein SLEP1_g9167 [Rubroshorea leprosula]